MRRGGFVLIMITAVLALGSCNKNLDKKLFGTWSVTKVEGVRYSNGSAGFSAQDNNPTGTVKFESNGRGEQNYSFTIATVTYPQTGSFTWEANDDEIVIVRSGESDLIWTRITNTEVKQVATYRVIEDAQTYWDYTLTLEK